MRTIYFAAVLGLWGCRREPATSAAPGAGDIADKMQMVQKKNDTHEQVLRNRVQSPTGMMSAEFEMAWSRIPEDDRRALTADQLADRIFPRPTDAVVSH